jgi:methyl-accepting chemotaxis protein
MNNWTIAKRITFGFSALLIVVLILGALAIVGMRKTHVDVEGLRREEVPQVAIANQIERDVQLTMYQMRVYGETENTTYLQNGRQRLGELISHIAEARQLGAREAGLSELKQTAEKLDVVVKNYSQSVELTVEKTQAIDSDRKQLNAAAELFAKACSAYREDMYAESAEETATNASPELQRSRLKKSCRLTGCRSWAKPAALPPGGARPNAISTKSRKP